MSTTQHIATDPIPLTAGDWRVIPARTELGFDTRILFGLIPVRGTFTAEGGNLHVDEAGSASGALRSETESVSTGIGRRDKHLRSADFFEATRHPQMRFELTSLVLDADSVATLTGALHIRGNAIPVSAPAHLTSVGSDELRIETEFGVDPHAAGFAFKRLPRTVQLRATVTLERAS